MTTTLVQQARRIYFCGIGGIGMSALAQLFHDEGKEVCGSDSADSQLIEALKLRGIDVSRAQDGSSITREVDLCIFTSAMPPGHPERKKAAELGIPSLSYFEAVGQYAREFEHVIAVSGTHGKSTTTTLIGLMLIEAGFDPTIIVGTVVKEFASNARKGGKSYLVVEACEYKEHMLSIHPHMVVLTNIEADHLDYYRDLDHIVDTFQKYLDTVPHSGVVFKNIDDAESADLSADARVVTYGCDAPCDVRATHIRTHERTQVCTVAGHEYTLHIPGKFNIYNVTAALAVARTLGISSEACAKVLRQFRGVWRRFEVVGEYRNATVISDYAHHPTAVHSTIRAAREFYPGRRIVAVFQPHQRSRTQQLFDGFVDACAEADLSIIQEVYEVAGREEGESPQASLASKLAKAIERKGKYAFYTPDVSHTRRELDALLETNDVILIMGAGDIYHLADALVV